jgi:DNA-directed RNA polymerase specialized sigma24 family protein
VRAAIEAMTPEEKTAIVKITQTYAWKTPYSGEDLLQEAIGRILGGRRPWPKRLTPMPFLCGVARSIADEWRHEEVGSGGDLDEASCDMALPDRTAIAKLDLERVLALFENDPTKKAVVLGLAAGGRGNELQKQVGLTTTRYASMLRDIKRKIDKFKADGGYEKQSSRR